MKIILGALVALIVFVIFAGPLAGIIYLTLEVSPWFLLLLPAFIGAVSGAGEMARESNAGKEQGTMTNTFIQEQKNANYTMMRIDMEAAKYGWKMRYHLIYDTLIFTKGQERRVIPAVALLSMPNALSLDEFIVLLEAENAITYAEFANMSEEDKVVTKLRGVLIVGDPPQIPVEIEKKWYEFWK